MSNNNLPLLPLPILKVAMILEFEPEEAKVKSGLLGRKLRTNLRLFEAQINGNGGMSRGGEGSMGDAADRWAVSAGECEWCTCLRAVCACQVAFEKRKEGGGGRGRWKKVSWVSF